MVPCHLFFFVLFSLKPLALSDIRATDDFELQDDAQAPCYIYKALATELLEDNRNFYSLQNVFFSPNSGSPVFVTVTYHYEDDNNATSSSTAIYFWSSAIYFFFFPVRIFQFTSLLFSDPALRVDQVDLYLSANYSSAGSDCMLLLTQRVSHCIVT
jgi:hypothetical protein